MPNNWWLHFNSFPKHVNTSFKGISFFCVCFIGLDSCILILQSCTKCSILIQHKDVIIMICQQKISMRIQDDYDKKHSVGFGWSWDYIIWCSFNLASAWDWFWPISIDLILAYENYAELFNWWLYVKRISQRALLAVRIFVKLCKGCWTFPIRNWHLSQHCSASITSFPK